MRSALLLVPIGILAIQGCTREVPLRVEDKSLGIAALFPGQPRLHKFSEATPFGDMEWFSTTYETPGRLDRSFFINVGNLPPGNQGGSTESEVLATLERFLVNSMGRIDVTPLPASRGPGFRYKAHLSNGAYAEGISIVKRGRIHRAQATVAKADDFALRTFIESFEVL